MVRRKKSLGKRAADAAPTWYAHSNAWRKRLTVNGKQRQFRFKFPHTSDGRRKAADAWRQEHLTLKTGTRLAELRQQADAILETLNDEQHPDWRHTWEYVAGTMKSGVSYDEAMRGAAHIVSGRAAVRNGRYTHAANALEVAATIADPQPEPASIDDAEDQVSGILDVYLEAQKREHSLGAFGKLRFSSIRRWIEREKKTDLGLTPTPTDEDDYGKMLIAYRTRCEDELINKQYGKPGFDDRMRDMRKFIGWASENYKLPRMPRNVKSALSKFNEQGESAKSIPDDLLIKIAANSSGWLRTAIALSLNCGFYAADFAYLSPEDIKDGCLHFVRGKTQRKANGGKGVKVVYKLWDETLDLIRRYGNSRGDLLLTDGQGNPVYRERANSVDDRCYRAFRDACKDANVKGYSYLNVRDTGTTLIEEIDQKWSDIYGAHVDKRIARLYIDGSKVDYKKVYAEFAVATDAMRNRLAGVLEALKGE